MPFGTACHRRWVSRVGSVFVANDFRSGFERFCDAARLDCEQQVSRSAGNDAVTLSNGQVVIGSFTASLTNVEELDLNLGAGADTIASSGNASVTTGLLVLNVAGGGSVAMTVGRM